MSYDDSLSFKSLNLMLDSFKGRKRLGNSSVYWTSSQDYATAMDMLWRNSFSGNQENVPASFLRQLSGLKERYVLLVRFTGYKRHWTNLATRSLLYLINELSFGLFGLDEDDLFWDAAPEVNMKVLAVDRLSEKIIYKEDLDLLFMNPIDSTTFQKYSLYYFGEK